MVAYSKSLKDELADAHARAALARQSAFVDYTATVCGFRLLPITLRTHNALLAFQNGFVTPGAPITAPDVANFVWIHHPEFGQFAREARRRVYRQVARQLNPAWGRLNDLLVGIRLICPKRLQWRRPILSAFYVARKVIPLITGPTMPQRHETACAEISRLLREAVGDFPKGDDKNGPLPCSFEAHILNSMRRGMAVPYGETEAMPMKRLSQFMRESVHHATEGKAGMLNDEEAAIWAEYLRRKTEEANTPEAIAAEKAKMDAAAKRAMAEGRA